jgi:hypothetical protein
MAKGMGLWVWVLALTGGTAAGCGGSGNAPPPNCDQVQPCGGDLIGTWNILGGCANTVEETKELQSFCPGGAIRAFGMNMSGSITFNADLTFTRSDWKQTLVASETIPLSCVVGSTSCAELAAQSSTSSQTSSTQINCAGSSTCKCTVFDVETMPTDTGTYAVYTASLLVSGPLTGMSSQYCVEGTRLHMMQVSSTRTGPNLEAIVLSDIVAERQ